MNKALLIFFSLLGTIASAQMGPCFIEEELREREIYYMMDELPDQFDLGEKGDNNLWLFTELMAPRSYTYIYASAEKGKYFEHFPESSMVLREPWGREIYYGSRDGRWYILGEGSLEKDSFVPLISKYKVPMPACAPDKLSSKRLSRITYDVDDKAHEIKVDDVKDAAGTLYLADGIYDAYRIERKTTDVQTLDSTLQYSFIDMHTGDFLLEAWLDKDENLTKVIYKTNNPTLNKDVRLEKNNFLLYPNRGYGQIRMEFQNFDAGNYTLVVKQIIGKEIWRNTYRIDGDETLKEDLSFLPRGVYTYAIIDANQNQILTRRLAIIKS